MNCGLPSVTIEKIRGVLASYPEIEDAILYGSRAKGNHKPGSDIDLTLRGKALTADLRDAVASALDDLLLPYMIDLSLYDQIDQADLQDHIDRVGVVFYARKDPALGSALRRGIHCS